MDKDHRARWGARQLCQNCGDYTSADLRYIQRSFARKGKLQPEVAALRAVRGMLQPGMRLREIDDEAVVAAYRAALD